MTTKPLAKRPYRKPTLVVYGSVPELTRAVGNMGAVKDGGAGMTNKSA